MHKFDLPKPKAGSISKATKSKLKRMGYTVTPIKSLDLPKNFSWHDTYMECWYKLSVQGMPVTNNTCEHNLWNSQELTRFADKLPEVNQMAFA